MGTVLVAFGVLIALVTGFFTSQESSKEKPVRGGTVSQVAHYIACGGMSAIPAVLLLTLFLTLFTPENLFRVFVPYVIGSLVIVLLSLVVHAAAEPEGDFAPAEVVHELD